MGEGLLLSPASRLEAEEAEHTEEDELEEDLGVLDLERRSRERERRGSAVPLSCRDPRIAFKRRSRSGPCSDSCPDEDASRAAEAGGLALSSVDIPRAGRLLVGEGRLVGAGMGAVAGLAQEDSAALVGGESLMTLGVWRAPIQGWKRSPKVFAETKPLRFLRTATASAPRRISLMTPRAFFFFSLSLDTDCARRSEHTS